MTEELLHISSGKIGASDRAGEKGITGKKMPLSIQTYPSG
jgi:hypothetical protein